MRRLCLVLTILFLISHIDCLHFQRVPVKHMTAQSQLQALKAQQASFENQVNNLITNITTIQSKFKASNSTSDKIVTLENAIISERETIFELSNSLIPPFNLSKNACQELTNEQKINLLDQVNKAKQQISKIKTLALSVPPCAQLKMINSDITKQGVLIDSIEKIIYTKCDSSIILSPTIFQSNIYASNWILGNQTIDDLIEQYYQRSIQYDNITNCPLQYPFFDGKSCISCNQNDSVFNMYTKKCDFCPFDTQINTGLRKCQQVPHYSDYNGSSKYSLDGADRLPTPDPKLTPCDKKTPFWNGTCNNCKNGKWWSVKDSICKSCPAGKAFDINLKSCITPAGSPYLTILEGTQWVSSNGNLTNVLKERAALINGSQAQIQQCSSASPYFDGLQCISCDNQFDLAKLKCTSAPVNSSYDDNLHAYTPVLSNKETNVKASNILSSKLLVNSSIPDCDISTPYYDGITCIFCQQPFILFDNQKKTCVACQPNEIYNNVTKKCDKRNITLISTNFNNLLATQGKSIEQYKKQLSDKVTNNKEDIIDKCKDAKQYSNYSSCFTCRPTEYFNVQTKNCVTCNGTINLTTSLCIPKNTLITNLTSTPNLLLTDNKNLDNLTKQQSQILGPIQICPKATPYAVQGISCIACSSPSIYFDLKQQKCVACPIDSFYNNISLICQQGIFVSNLTALTKYIQVDNYTVANLKNQISQLNKTKPLIICPQATPFSDGNKCSACPNNTYVNLKNFSCSSPIVVANVNALNELENVFQEDNYTVNNIAANISKITLPTLACDVEKPAFNGTDCYSCPSDQYYKLKTNKCVEGATVTNTAELKKLKNIKQTDNYTVVNIQKVINTSSSPTFPCNESKPLFNGKKCIKCDVYQLYDLKQLVCIPPQMYTNTSALKNLKYIQLGNYTINTTDVINAKISIPKKPCPPQSPLFNKVICISCPNDTYYNLQSLNCTVATTVTNVDAIRKSNNFIETDNNTLTNITQNISKIVLPTVPCDSLKPLYNGTTCIACSNNSLYSIKNLTCVTCAIQDYYDKTTNKCTPKPNYYPNLNNNNWIVGNSSIDKALNFTKSRKDLKNSLPCPSNASFFNNNTFDCQSCPNETYFSYDTFNCTPCGKNQQVDPNTHQCAIRIVNGSFQTNLNSKNLIYNGISKGQLQDIYSSNKSSYLNIKDCPQNKPYFDGFDCITCHPSIQYFNLETQRCQNCGTEGATYDNSIHDCVKQNQVVNVSPNPAKMYSSIF